MFGSISNPNHMKLTFHRAVFMSLRSATNIKLPLPHGFSSNRYAGAADIQAAPV
jgi:hypothetical protein